MTNKPTPDKPPPGWGPTHDLAFKKLLASPDHMTVAQGFIETFFALKVDLVDITITNPYAIVGNPEETADRRRLIQTFRDITYTVGLADVTVELQVRRRTHFEARALYYACNLFNRHYHETDPDTPDRDQYYASLRPVYSLNVLEYLHFDCAHAVHMFDLADALWPEEQLRLGWLKVGFVEIARTKTEFKAETQRLWCDFLASGQAPPGAPDYLREAASMINYVNLTGEEQAVIDLVEKFEADRAAEIEWAEKDGEDRARRRMMGQAMSRGRSVQEIADFFGVPLDEAAAWAGNRSGSERAVLSGAEA